MLEFRDLSISDKPMADKALAASDFRGSEYSFANNLAWRRLADTKCTFYKDFYLLCAFGSSKDDISFTFPAGSGSYSDVLSEMKRTAESFGVPLRIGSVTAEQLDIFRELFPDRYTVAPNREGSDYIYGSKDLIELPGRKYHGKRNHLARYKEQDCQFSLITEKDLDDCILFCTETYNSKSQEADSSFISEQFALNTFFTHFDELGLQGGIIRKEGQVKAVTIGERLCSDTYCVHIEKADTSVNGIYAGINNLFAQSCMSGYKYVNREEDLGLEGLRKAKLSYHPVFILEKYIVTFK